MTRHALYSRLHIDLCRLASGLCTRERFPVVTMLSGLTWPPGLSGFPDPPAVVTCRVPT
ncbi:putative leader peptide [Sphaerisporangium sp. NPDC051017]|uniref:putative leader peptide n=1 Tax=unclassified Sphaerisporangium TaxID=2630420 RepID=UPI0033C8E0F1